MKVFAHVPRDWGATIYYRVHVPFRSLEQTVPDFEGLMEEEGKSAPHRVAEVFTHADLALVYQPVSDGFLEQVGKIKEYMTVKRPAVVVDTDDNLFNVNAYNHAFKELGVKRPDGRPLRTGDAVIVEMESGAKRVLFRDNQFGFSVIENWYRIETLRKAYEMADMVSCSTPAVQAAIKYETKQPNTWISPNHILFDEFDKVELREHPGELRILWQGSPTHILDLYNIRDTVIKVAKKYPHTKWIFWGHDYAQIGDHIPDQYVHIPWMPYSMFKLKLSTIGHDIALAPLASDNSFEECRSAIKWYESSAISRPAPVIAQSTGAFKAEMKDGETGLLFENMDEFEEKLCTLIENETLRRTLATNAADWVHENRDALKFAPTLYARWNELIHAVNTKGELNGNPTIDHHLQPS